MNFFALQGLNARLAEHLIFLSLPGHTGVTMAYPVHDL